MISRQSSSSNKRGVQRRLNSGFKQWSRNHSERYQNMGTSLYCPWIFPDQRIDRAKRPITRASIFLPETAYLKAYEWAYAKSVGSTAVANTIIEGFGTIQASEDGEDPRSLTEYTIDFLGSGSGKSPKEISGEKRPGGMALGITSAHLDRLSDITDFTAGLNLSVAKEKGRKYIDRFGFVINKNTTRETYMHLPLPWFASFGLEEYFGIPPGKSADKYGLDEEIIKYVNGRMSSAMLRDKKEKDRVVWGIVPAGSGMTPVHNESTGALEKLVMGDTSYTSALLARCEGGVIPASRYGDEILIGSTVPTEREEGTRKKDFEKTLADRVVRELAKQAFELTGGAVIEFPQLVSQNVGRIAA